MHPILASRRFLTAYVAATLPLAALLVGVLARPGAFSVPEAAGLALPLALLSVFLSLSVWYTARALPLRGTRMGRLLATHGVAAVVTASVWVMVGAGAAWLLDGLWPGRDLPARYRGQVPALLSTGALLYLLSVALNYVLLAIEAAQQAERQAMELRILAREAQLTALKAQIHPHFLFNSLNSISALAASDPAGAREMCALLADFLRRTLAVGERASIPVEEELALARTYLAVEGRRFGSRLAVEEDVDESGRACRIPPLLLQPLLENAVRHGIASRLDGGVVRLEARTAGSTLRLAVENPVDPEAPIRPGNGLGLANVRRRLEARYGAQALLETRRLADRYRVVLSLPAEVEP